MAKEEKEGGGPSVLEIIGKINPRYQKPVWEHSLVYDSPAEQLEPVYFWIIDFMSDLGFETEKIVDNFSASPGSGYFAELGAKATRMQEEGMKIMQTIGVMLKSLVNLLYDLKEFEIRLKQYALANSKNEKERESGLAGLKQIWMDRVDIQRGNTSIKGLASQFMYATLIDAFMAAKKPEDVDKMDLNDRVKRILKPRLAEFLEWKERSEIELRKRFEIERAWVKGQVSSLKLYTRWAKPYLKAAEELMMKGTLKEPAITKAFNTVLLQLTLLGKNKIKVHDEADSGNLPEVFRKLKLKRDYYACVLVDFRFRGIPRRGAGESGYYIFGGRADVSFRAFALNEDELKVLANELDKEDFRDALKLVENLTEESLSSMITELEHFTAEEKREKEKTEKEKGKKGKPEKEKLEIGRIKKDSFEESVVRALAERKAAELCFKIYDIYKKSHGMASFAEPSWEMPERWKAK
ncbi:MAG: hypothetical protein K6T16_01205 [Candidatus Pacearchaeota archaeon]|nr:hypothetical protein [Candidatus Pacearchaeota archaeon]